MLFVLILYPPLSTINLKWKQAKEKQNMSLNTRVFNNGSSLSLPSGSRETRTRTLSCKGKTSELKQQQKEVRKVMLDQTVRMYEKELERSKNKIVSGLTFHTILEAFDSSSWMTRHTFFYHYEKKGYSRLFTTYHVGCK